MIILVAHRQYAKRMVFSLYSNRVFFPYSYRLNDRFQEMQMRGKRSEMRL